MSDFYLCLTNNNEPFVNKDMKTRILIAVILIAWLAACTQKTCPTYAKKDIKKSSTLEERI